jgi:hypothetical protein
MQGALVQQFRVTCHDLIITLVKALKNIQLDTLHQRSYAAVKASQLHKIENCLAQCMLLEKKFISTRSVDAMTRPTCAVSDVNISGAMQNQYTIISCICQMRAVLQAQNICNSIMHLHVKWSPCRKNYKGNIEVTMM